MNRKNLKQLLAITMGFGLWLAGAAVATGQVRRDIVETFREDLKSDRKALIAEEMNFTEQESDAFWPIYRSYRAEVEKVTDRIVKLVFEYSDLYPDVPDPRARQMLTEYTKVEADLLGIKRKYFKKLGKVLPPSKVFRFAQLDNRFDLGTRVALAAWLPMMPAQQAGATNEER